MTIEILKPDLPNMPDEVIDVWLMTHYRRFGWPPTANPQWKYIFGLGRPLEYFQHMNWERAGLELTPHLLTPKALQVIVGLVETHYFHRDTVFARTMSDSRERLENCMAYLKEHGTFPRPVILHATPQGYEILDGNHRMTAFFYLWGMFNIPNGDPDVPCLKVQNAQPFWVGSNAAVLAPAE